MRKETSVSITCEMLRSLGDLNEISHHVTTRNVRLYVCKY